MRPYELFALTPCPNPLSDGSPCGHPLERYFTGQLDCYSCMTRYDVETEAVPCEPKGTFELRVKLKQTSQKVEVPRWYKELHP